MLTRTQGSFIKRRKNCRSPYNSRSQSVSSVPDTSHRPLRTIIIIMPRSLVWLAAAALAVTADAFVVQPRHPAVSSLTAAAKFDKEGHHITINPMEGYKGVDVDRARECAEHFGECSVEEIEQLKNNLHKERLQNFAVGGSAMTQPKEDALEHVLLEEELELQLGLLKDQNSGTDLFPDDEAELQALPHLKDPMSSSSSSSPDNKVVNAKQQQQHHEEGPFHKPTPSEILELEETVLEENLLEPFLICMAIACIAFVPQLLNV